MAKGISPQEREKRNALILQMFLAGWSYREIGRHPRVELTATQVGRVLQEEIKEAAKRHDLLSDKALNVYVERLETMLKAAWPLAVGGDLKAIEVVRRLLDQQARLYDLEEESKAGGLPPVGDNEIEGDDDELSAYRKRRRG